MQKSQASPSVAPSRANGLSTKGNAQPKGSRHEKPTVRAKPFDPKINWSHSRKVGSMQMMHAVMLCCKVH